MNGQLADFLAAHSERVAEIWAQLQGSVPEQRTGGGTRGPRQFLSAALVALSADDLGPLMAFDEVGQADTAERKVQICQRAYALLTEQIGDLSRLGQHKGAG